MKERPILFSGSMVRAILDGRKTQTRRVATKTPLQWLNSASFTPAYVALPDNGLSPYGYADDRLWVRETWAQPTTLDPGPTFYRADYPACVPRGFENVPPASEITWKPSIHMPRAASRITLEVTGVLVERLQSISEADARAEGAYLLDVPGGGYKFARGEQEYDTAVEAYRELWDGLNAARGFGWDTNPWVWVIEFKRASSEALHA